VPFKYRNRRVSGEWRVEGGGWEEGEWPISFFLQNFRQFPILALVVGVLAGAFGIGGGLIQAPLMLALGVVPGN
jgi:uncharacterized membrane protein YfcA